MTETVGTYDLFEQGPQLGVTTESGVLALALAELHRRAGDYDPEFVSWLKANWPLWTAFCRIADDVRSTGHSNYSARAVFHVLRYETLMRERAVTRSGTPLFKINNRWSASMSRLYNGMSREREGFFFTRESGA